MIRFYRNRFGKDGRAARANAKTARPGIAGSKSASTLGLPGGVSRIFSVKTLLTEESVQDFTSNNEKSILYFTANWCGPCAQIKPIYEGMSKKYDSVAFGRVDVDDNEESAQEFSINAVPTFIAFEGSKPVQRISGADATELEEIVKQMALSK